MSATSATRLQALAAIRGGWGALLLAAPGRVLATIPDTDATADTRTLARMLGARHAAQAAAALTGSKTARRGWWIDALHATSMLGLAAAAPAHRRLAAIDATIAAAFAAATFWAR